MKLVTFILGLSLSASLLAQDDQFTIVRDSLKKLAPNLVVDSDRKAPFDGFAEVLAGAQLVYISLDGKYLIDGRLIDVTTGKDLSEKSKGIVRRDRLAKVSGSEQISFPAKGETKHKITVFTDIDCGYCRRLHNQMAEYNEMGIEVNYMMFPRAGVSSHSFEKAVSVWCAEDSRSALTAAKNGEEPAPLSCANPIEQHFNLGRELGVTGTPALVAADGTLLPGYMPPAQLLGTLESLAVTPAE